VYFSAGGLELLRGEVHDIIVDLRNGMKTCTAWRRMLSRMWFGVSIINND